MRTKNDIQNLGKHDFDRESAESYAAHSYFTSFSIGIFQWELMSNGMALKRGKVKVRVQAPVSKKNEAFSTAEEVVRLLDEGKWSGKKTVTIK